MVNEKILYLVKVKVAVFFAVTFSCNVLVYKFLRYTV